MNYSTISLLHTPTLLCNFYFLFLCSVLRWQTGRAPSPSMNFLPRTLTAMKCPWKNTGIFWVMLLILITAPHVSHKVLCSTCYIFLPPTCFFSTRGHVCIIVNVASKWGKTKVNYTQLAEMHASYAEKGLRILGFPCNQFGGQVRIKIMINEWLKKTCTSLIKPVIHLGPVYSGSPLLALLHNSMLHLIIIVII